MTASRQGRWFSHGQGRWHKSPHANPHGAMEYPTAHSTEDGLGRSTTVRNISHKNVLAATMKPLSSKIPRTSVSK
eukprot:CAMPEP_0118960256 /NCGR_PEP_ID=MMETSP1169-20130426/63548_1 /TAXON_ID=36882 /ORGANISM="Pyramimonas obovata, Strain CCMP722" /LENGTH=74 /DNA_ID=CAMNT_0006908405 /DNA_START=122 /DNA_END=346 /DNA_ORIENTATION=-